MGEIEEWFLMEFGHLGFSLTHTLYDATTFVPCKKVMYHNRMTNIRISPDMAQDITCHYPMDAEYEYKSLLRGVVEQFLEINKRDFKPIKQITKLNFK